MFIVINIITIIDITTKCTWFDNTWSCLLFFILFVLMGFLHPFVIYITISGNPKELVIILTPLGN